MSNDKLQTYQISPHYMTNSDTQENTPHRIQPLSTLPAPSEHWLFGSMGKFDRNRFHYFLDDLQAKHGPIFKIRLLHKTFVVIADSDIRQYMYKKRPDTYTRDQNIPAIFKEAGAHGIFSAEGKEWLSYRQLINSAFKPGLVKKTLPVIQKSTDRFIAILGKQTNCPDIVGLLQCLTIDITAELSFNHDINTLQNKNADLQHHLSILFPMLSQRLLTPIPYWRLFRRKQDKTFDSAVKAIYQSMKTFVHDERQRIANKTPGDSLLRALLLAKDDNGDSYPDKAIYGNMLTLLLAGNDTSSHTLAWVIHYLSQDIPLQTRLYHELMEQNPESRTLSDSDLDNYPLAMAVIQESMRLNPVVHFFSLENQVDDVVNGYQCPAGTAFFVLTCPERMDANLFPDPHTFNPDRWLNMPEETRKRYAHVMAVFGGGPRLCPGRQLAFMEMKLILITIVRHFIIRATPDNGDVESVFAFTVVPKNLSISIEKRASI